MVLLYNWVGLDWETQSSLLNKCSEQRCSSKMLEILSFEVKWSKKDEEKIQFITKTTHCPVSGVNLLESVSAIMRTSTLYFFLYICSFNECSLIFQVSAFRDNGAIKKSVKKHLGEVHFCIEDFIRFFEIFLHYTLQGYAKRRQDVRQAF